MSDKRRCRGNQDGKELFCFVLRIVLPVKRSKKSSSICKIILWGLSYLYFLKKNKFVTWKMSKLHKKIELILNIN